MEKLTVEQVRRMRKNYGDRRRRANKKFVAADKAGKRVIIAKDVLAQLMAGRIKAKNLTYLKSNDLREAMKTARKDPKAGEVEVCDIINKSASCTACALGSVFVSAVGIKDALKLKDVMKKHYGDDYEGNSDEIVSSASMHKYLGSIFSERQLHMIENAFEGWPVNVLKNPGSDSSDWNNRNYALENSCNAFNGGDPSDMLSGAIKSPRKRLERIMYNIIENNGTFVP